MVSIGGLYDGIAQFDTLMWSRQFAYGENIEVQDPDYMRLSQKPTNYIATGTNMASCYIQGYYGCENGTFYNQSWVLQHTTTSGNDILWGWVVSSYIYFVHLVWSSYKLGRVSTSDASSNPGDRSAGGTYDESWYSLNNSSSWHHPFYIDGSVVYFANGDDIMKLEGWVVSSEIGFPDVVKWLVFQGDYLYVFTEDGYMHLWDLFSSRASVSRPLNIYPRYVGTDDVYNYVVGGKNATQTALYVQTWYEKQVLARHNPGEFTENKWRFNFGKIDWPIEKSNFAIKAQEGFVYLTDWGKLFRYGTSVSTLNPAMSIIASKNSSGDNISEIWMLDIWSASWRLYFSRKDESGNCWVDYILVADNDPTSFSSSGFFYTMRYTLGWPLFTVPKFDLRADIPSWTTIVVSASVNNAAYTQLIELDSTYTNRQFNYTTPIQGNEIQFKIELTTTDSSVTPKLFSFNFDPELNE